MRHIDRPAHAFDADFHKGGAGSGNHGHAGRPGEVGGSAPDGDGNATSTHDLPAKFKAYAHDLKAQAEKNDPVVTPVLQVVAHSLGGQMVGLEHRIKLNTERMAQKMAENATEANLTPEQARESVYDALRYTVELDPQQYAEGAQSTLAALRERGFEVYDSKDKNYWDENSTYRGLNYVMADKAGNKFELQFHTKESLAAKERVHKIYEKFRAPGVTPEQRKIYATQMLGEWKGVTFPRGVEKLGRKVVQTA